MSPKRCRQVAIRKEDRDLQRILWHSDWNQFDTGIPVEHRHMWHSFHVIPSNKMSWRNCVHNCRTEPCCRNRHPRTVLYGRLAVFLPCRAGSSQTSKNHSSRFGTSVISNSNASVPYWINCIGNRSWSTSVSVWNYLGADAGPILDQDNFWSPETSGCDN